MAVSVNRLTNANIYMDGVNFLGQVEEANLPDVKFMFAEHKALGMVGKVELPSGVDKLEAKLKFNAPYRDAARKLANPYKSVSLQLRGNLETYSAAGKLQEVPYVVFLVVTPKNAPMGNFKQHDNVELEVTLNCTYVRQEIDGESVMELDVLANMFKVDGEDMLQNYRANIGG